MEIGKRIAQVRQEKGLSQSALARVMNVVPSAVCQIESGMRNPSYAMLRSMATALGVSVRQLIRASDAAAFDAMVRAYRKRVLDFVAKLGLPREDARDVTQDVLLRMWLNRKQWKGSGNLDAYLTRTALNRAISTLCHRPVAVETEEPFARVKVALDGLPVRCRQVFLLKRQRKLSNAEIAARLRISKKTVEVHVTMAYKRMRTALGDDLT